MKLLFSLILFLISNILLSQAYKPVFKTYLDESVNETSGLILYNGKLWTHNDSGGEPRLYNVDTINGNVISSKVIRNAKNRDWEDVAIDDKYAYIGDIGNNSASHKKFTIYRVLLDDLDSPYKDTIDSERIIFRYDPEYYKKNSGKKKKKRITNFDCEAFIIKGDSIYLFSKNWGNKKCYFYTIPKVPGEYTANIRDTLDVKGLVCGADYNQETNTLALIGYVYGIPAPSLLILLSGFEDDNFFSGNVFRKELELVGCQTEGIVFSSNSHLIISNENFLGYKQSLHDIKIDSLNGPDDQSGNFMVFADSFKNEISFNIPESGRYKIIIKDTGGSTVKKVSKKRYSKGIESINISRLEKGEYSINVLNSKICFSGKFHKE